MTAYQIPKGIAFKKLQEELFFLTPRTSEMHTLDTMGATMLTLLLEGNSPSEVGEQLSKEYDAPRETIARDTETLLKDLLDKGLLEQIEDLTP